jgi:hypothetical protein
MAILMSLIKISDKLIRYKSNNIKLTGIQLYDPDITL